MEIRPVGSHEFDAFVRAVHAAAGLQAPHDTIDSVRESYELERTLAAFDGSRIVGGTGYDLLELTLPGAVAVAARIKETGVLPTHRRRGVLTALMTNLLRDLRASGHALSILYAAEAGIFGRFGYGPASIALAVEIDRSNVILAAAAPVGQLRLLSPEEAGDLVPAVFDEHRRGQPGQVERPPGFWRRWLADAERDRRGAGPRFIAAHHEDDGHAAGYVSYRYTGGYPPTTERTLVVEDLVATSASARRSLWSYCLGVDLIGAIRCANVPVDEPLRWMLEDQRRLRVTGLTDFLWVRLIDVPRALGARRYASTGRMVLDIADDVLPEAAGRYLVEVTASGASCRPTDRQADVALGVGELASAYLGGVRLATLARAGRVTEVTAGGLARADALFAWEPAPWTVTDW